jgi:dCMP deaminase
MIIGLTGTLNSGKGSIAGFFKEIGFVKFSLSDELRELARESKIELTRENLQNLGNKMRREFGAGFLAEIVKNKILSQKHNNAVIEGIRNPGEVEILRTLNNFFLVSVDAPADIRFKRMKARNRENDPKTWEDFLKVDARDLGEADERGQQTRKCMALADFTLINDSTPELLNIKISNLYNKMLLKIPRPKWDEYFMKMAALVSERSTCLRHHVGAIVVKDKRVLTTGYNGAARGMKDCTELGCLRNELGIASGTRHEICRAIHAEQNAIIQAGIHGINISGSALYCTHTPCIICAKIIVQSGIKEIISYQDYADEDARKFLESAGVILRKIPRPYDTINFRD